MPKTKNYHAAHAQKMEFAISKAMHIVLTEQPDDPIATLAEVIAAQGEPLAPGGPARLVLPPLQEVMTGDWSLTAWLQGIGLHRIAAAAIAKKAGSYDHAATLEFLRGLTSRDDVAQMLRTEAAIETQIDVVWGAVERIQQAGAAANEEVESKFEGAIGMDYGGLDTYFGGLEGVVGGPSQKIREGMAAEHLSGSESDEFFTSPCAGQNVGYGDRRYQSQNLRRLWRRDGGRHHASVGQQCKHPMHTHF